MRALLRSNLLLFMFLVGAASGVLVSGAGWWGLQRDAASLENLHDMAGTPLAALADAQKLNLRAESLFLDALRRQRLSQADEDLMRTADLVLGDLLAELATGENSGRWQEAAALHRQIAAARAEVITRLHQEPAQATALYLTDAEPLSIALMSALNAHMPQLLTTGEALRGDAMRSNRQATTVLVALSLLATVSYCLIAILSWLEMRERRRQTAQHEREHTMFRTLFQSSNDGVFLLKDGHISDLNQAALRLFAVPSGMAPAELDLARLQPVAADEVDGDALQRALAGGETGLRFEHRFRALDGREFPAEVALDLARLDDGDVVQLTVRDITRRHQAENAMRLANQAFENSLEGIAITDARGNILTVNAMFCTITGYGPEEVIGRNPNILSSGRQTREFYDDMWRTLQEQGKWGGEVWNKRKNGEIYPQWLTISRVTNERGRVTNFVGVFSDITERKSAEERMLRQVYYDSLTDLPNRMLFNDRLKQVLGMARRHNDRPFAVMFLDLDRFKLVNDTLGHQAGDSLLQQAAHRLRGSVRESDTVARMSGDEFTVLLSEISDPQHAASVARKILDAFRRPFPVGGEDIYISPSIGISVYPQDGRSAEALLKNADMAMYRAKGAGGAAYELHDPGLAAVASERLALESALHRALEQGQIALHYQPRFECDSGRLHGFEASPRWHHPERGELLPETFLPLAEESALTVRLAEWMLDTACQQAQSWRREHPGHRVITVHLSTRQFHSPDLIDQVRHALQRSGLPAFCLELEVDEATISRDLTASTAIMKQLTATGVQFAIDGFGAGNAALPLLKTLPVHALKMDPTLIQELDRDGGETEIINAILVMSTRLGMRVIADGVSHPAQLALLKKYKGVLGQGRLLGPAIGADEAGRLLSGGRLKLVAA